MSERGRSPNQSRRAFLRSAFLGKRSEPEHQQTPAQDVVRLALIMPAQCLAYRQQVCTTCMERCPEPGAIKLDSMYPRVIPDACTGCGECQQVCPAPDNAVMLLPRTPDRYQGRGR